MDGFFVFGRAFVARPTPKSSSSSILEGDFTPYSLLIKILNKIVTRHWSKNLQLFKINKFILLNICGFIIFRKGGDWKINKNFDFFDFFDVFSFLQVDLNKLGSLSFTVPKYTRGLS